MSLFKKTSFKTSATKKRKVSNGDTTTRMKRIKRNKQEDDVTSDESDGEMDTGFKSKSLKEYSSSESEDETADQKRKRLAQEHLDQLREYASSDEEMDGDDDQVARKLQEENLARRGRLHKTVAAQYIEPTLKDVTMCRGHSSPITCVALTPDNKFVFTGSKDCSIIKWSVESGKKVHQIPCGKKNKSAGHLAHVLCICISSDCQYLASGDSSSIIKIWNPVTCELLKSTSSHKHRAAVSGLAFRHGTHELYSASFDRTVKVWNVCDAGVVYVETLFGHQDIITAIDALSLGRAITSGAKDGSLRIWKIAEESQLVFHGHSGSIDCVCFVNDNHFLSGADDNSVALWSTLKKKPITTVKNAHPGNSTSGTMVASDNWITSVAAVRNTDLVATGSKDGYIRFWKCGEGFRTLAPLFSLPILGTVNSLQFSADGQLLVAGIGREHKLGRWWNVKQATNSLAIIRLSKLSKKATLVVDNNNI